MPIKTLQRQQAQVGRIRIGQQVPTGNSSKTRPAKLDRFRFTTPSRGLADAVAAKYGGTVEAWQPDGHAAEFEVISNATTLPVFVPPNPVTQFYELWSGAGCIRRCDGETDTISGDPCKCPLDHLERGDLAAKGQACKATTRLKVMLPELPGIGVWRLDTHGFYAAIELPQTADFLGAVTDAGGYIRATLALEERIVKRPGVGIRRFLVPALHVDVTPEALMAGAGTALPGRATAAIAAGATPRPSLGPLEIEAADDEAQKRAQGIADRLAKARTRDEVDALWREAGPAVRALEVADADDGVVSRLEDLLKAKGKALASAPTAPTAQPKANDTPPAAGAGEDLDEDEVWVAIIGAASEFEVAFDVDDDFERWSNGTKTGAASLEQLRAYLAHLQTTVQAVPV